LQCISEIAKRVGASSGVSEFWNAYAASSSMLDISSGSTSSVPRPSITPSSRARFSGNSHVTPSSAAGRRRPSESRKKVQRLIGPTGTVFRDEAERLEERILGPRKSALLTGADR
jgi:hypothetical protein